MTRFSRALNGYDPAVCYYCNGRFGSQRAKYLKFVTMSMWIYVCDTCKKRNLRAVRATRGHELEIQDAV